MRTSRAFCDVGPHAVKTTVELTPSSPPSDIEEVEDGITPSKERIDNGYHNNNPPFGEVGNGQPISAAPSRSTRDRATVSMDVKP